ncbi:MAG TPA: ribose-5-phosphate isomerase RpiA [Phycisphaerales bacterium]|nr:ribose-5-phosphate isomerase RpiA [Phycisphaerales bacterium]
MDRLAEQAVADVKSGMVVGLGTGRAASRGVRALGDRVRTEKLDIRCVSTSRATDDLAAELGLTVVDLNSVEAVDLLFDGADEVDPNLYMIKGGGGAMTRERIVAHAASRRVYMVDSGKLTPRLGTRFRLPVEVLPMAKALVQRELEDQMELEGTWRQRTMTGSSATTDYITDNGNLIFDLTLPAPTAASRDELYTLDADLKQLPGVVDHGLFLMECQTLLVEWTDGRVETRHRRDEA